MASAPWYMGCPPRDGRVAWVSLRSPGNLSARARTCSAVYGPSVRARTASYGGVLGGMVTRTSRSSRSIIPTSDVGEALCDLRRPEISPDRRQGRERHEIPHTPPQARGLLRLDCPRFSHSSPRCGEIHVLNRPAQPVVARVARSRIRPGGTKNGFTCRMPPMMTIGCVRMMSMTMLPPNLARSYVQTTASSYFGRTKFSRVSYSTMSWTPGRS